MLIESLSVGSLGSAKKEHCLKILKMQGTSCENPKDGLFSRIHHIYSLTPGDKIYSTENRVVSMEKLSKK